MRYVLLLMVLLSTAPAMSGTLHVHGPGGPAPAMKEAAKAFSRTHKVKVDVTTGPTAEWKAQAIQDADLLFSGSEEIFAKWGWTTTAPAGP